MPRMATLTERLIPLLRREVAAETRARARAHLLDWCACAAAAMAYPQGAMMGRFAASTAAGVATLIGADRREPLMAAFANGGLGNVLEMDDVHRASILHPGPIVIPAALAAVQAQGATLNDLLDAIVRGYEATIRIGRALGPSHYRYFHSTSSAGAFGAAAAVGSVLGLSDEALADALGNAGTRTGGVWQMRHEDVPSKSLHNAQAARAGYEAAALAALGFAGPRSILEGPQGLFAAMAPEADAALVTQSESDWLIHQTSFKPWPACRHAHPAIDAALALRAQLEKRRALDPLADPGPVVAVRLESYADALKFCDNAQPTTEAQAKFSLQHAVAMVLLHGTPKLTHYRSPHLESRYVAALRGRIAVAELPELTRAYPQHFGAQLALELRNGMTLRHRVNYALGDPENPMDARALKLKALALLSSVGMPELRQHELVWACMEGPDLAPVITALETFKAPL
jgi:2-methylcitrate dehydratase PrpD